MIEYFEVYTITVIWVSSLQVIAVADLYVHSFHACYYESHRTVESHQKFVYRPLPQTSTTAPT